MISGVNIEPPYAYLTPVVQEWITCIEKYARWHDEDNLPYWYNERANVSVLAGAAWRAGWVALEEYQSEKRRKGVDSENSTGRNDLYLSTEEKGYCIEAKVCYLDIDHREEIESLITGKLQSAQVDAGKLVGLDEEIETLGLVFAMPWCRCPNKATEAQINAFIDGVMRLPSPVKAWCFPDNAQKIKGETDDVKYYYPGVALIMDVSTPFP